MIIRKINLVRTAEYGKSVFRHGGFTLIELLTAMAVLSIMVIILSSFFIDAGSIWKDSMNKVETFEDAMCAIDLIKSDFSNMLYAPHESVYDPYFDICGVDGGTEDLPLSTVAFLIAGEGGIYQVGYAIDTNSTANISDDKLVRLYKTNPANFDDPGVPTSWTNTQDIAYTIKAMKIYYYDERTKVWQSSWDSPSSGMPFGIRVELTCLSRDDAKKGDSNPSSVLYNRKKFTSDIYIRNTR